MKLIDADEVLEGLRDMKVDGETFTTARNFAIIILEEAEAVAYKCPNCGTLTEYETKICPICGLKFEGKQE